MFKALRMFTVMAVLAPFLSLSYAVLRPTPAAAASSAITSSYQCFYPTADTYTYNFAPTTNYGGDETLQISSLGDADVVHQRSSFLRFDLSAIPNDAVILSADLRLYLTSATYGGEGRLKAAEGTWTEYGLTWNNSPSLSGLTYDTRSWGVGATGWRTWSAPQLVQEWVSGARVNRGLALVAFGVGVGPSEFHSREGLATRQPRLCVRWDTDVTTDLVIDAVEVTQSVQDLNNSVRLVTDKPTYVRVHARSTSGLFRTFATLEISNSSGRTTLHPQNPGAHIVVRTDPSREIVDHAFLFQLPSAFTRPDDTLVLTARVNPIVSGWRTTRYPPETDYSNNARTVTVTFEEAPRIGLIMYRGQYTMDDNGSTITYTTPITDIYQTRSWLLRAFPLSDIWMTVRVNDFGEVEFDSDTGDLVYPTSGTVNRWLNARRTWDLSEPNWYEDRVGKESEIRYYAMLTNSGVFMRGAMGSRTGSGPTGRAAAWDRDGIFGDWYAGHELGHSFGRKHVQGAPGGAEGACGGEEGVDANYPHPEGFISTDNAGSAALFGFDRGTGAARPYGLIPVNLALYDPAWRDVMTYCAPQWISDYTYEAILDYLQTEITPVSAVSLAAPSSAQQTDRLLVSGTIDPATNTAELTPLFVVPNAHDVVPRTPGNYAIVLRDSGGAELARYAFTPEELHSGPDNPDGPSVPPVNLLTVSEFVPYVAGTVRVDLTGPTGLLATVTAGAAAPSLTVTSPTAGQVFSGATVPIAWTASDSDGDELTFNVQFSADGGATWEMLAQGIRGTSIDLPRENLASTSQGRVRVWATDGIHTSSAESAGAFTTSTRNPEVTLLSPQPGTYVAVSQTLTLEATAYSPNIGTLDTNRIAWYSSVDGQLGRGEYLAVTGLTPGVHTITVLVGDGKGLASAQVGNIVVVGDPTELPTPPAGLSVGPSPLIFWPNEGIATRALTIDNEGGVNPIDWGALEFTPWLSVSPTTGSTPGQTSVTVDPTGLEPGTYSANIVFGTSASTQNRTVQVTMVIPAPRDARFVFLPLVIRQ
jgi:hypothetical protein